MVVASVVEMIAQHDCWLVEHVPPLNGKEEVGVTLHLLLMLVVASVHVRNTDGT